METLQSRCVCVCVFDKEKRASLHELVAGLHLTGDHNFHCLIYKALLWLLFYASYFGSDKTKDVRPPEHRQNKFLGIYAFLMINLMEKQVEK